MSIAGRYASTNQESISFAEQSVDEATADADADPDLLPRTLMTLAGSLALGGENSRALTILAQASSSTTGLLAAEIAFQRGTVLGRMGESTPALDFYDDALPVFIEHDDRESVAITLHNRGMLNLAKGNLEMAEHDMRQARKIYEVLGRTLYVAFEDHNLGMVAARIGDIPEALRLFDDSERRLLDLVGSAAEIQVSRVEVLLSAGLFGEALALAVEIAAIMHEAGLGQDEAEARMVGAQAALLAGDAELALLWADAAGELFEGQHRQVWAANARLVGIQAQYHANKVSPALVSDAQAITIILETGGHVIPAFNARLTVGRIGLKLGLVNEAVENLRQVAAVRTGPVELRIQSWLATALLRQATGNPAGADAAARAGMRLLDRYQAALGATDIRTGVERHGSELGALGMRLALDSGKPRRVLAWMERTRARALRHPPVTPSDDAGQAGDLAELRRISIEMRSAEGEKAIRLAREAKALQEAIRARGRTERSRSAGSDERVPDVVGTLGKRTLVEYASLDDRLWAVMVRDGRHTLLELGPEKPVLDELESLRFTMRRLARGRGAATQDLARHVAQRLDALLFRSIATGVGPLVIVPTPALHGTPWAALPTCRGRSITLAPSAELWWRATQRRRRSGPVLVAAGPDLDHAEAEMVEVGSLYPLAITLDPGQATVEGVRQIFEPAAVAHIACHASFEVENPMFSSLRLSDGDLTVYDMERMRRVPHMVVLSACDSGFSDAVPGEELMGLSAALLSMGARSLIASVGLVPDSDATRELMIAFHRGLISGLGPAESLSRAQVGIEQTSAGFVAAASFVCIGSG